MHQGRWESSKAGWSSVGFILQHDAKRQPLLTWNGGERRATMGKKEDSRYKEGRVRDDEGCQWYCISCKYRIKRKYTHGKTYFVGKGTCLK
jgi:hypothetical protein